MKTTLINLSLVTTLFLTGCGNSDETAVLADTTTDITVERGPVLQAALRDANGTMGQHLGNGIYRFTNIQYPVQSYGGYIDMNRNGAVDAGDIAMNQLRLKTNTGNVMTLATSLVAGEELAQELLDIGYSEDEISTHTPSTNRNIAALSDEVYKYCYENNITDPSSINKTQMISLQNRIQERKDFYALNKQSSAKLEDDLMQELEVPKLNDDDISKLPTNPTNTLIDAIPTVELTLEQKHTLAYMWNEERLAKDIYLALDALTPSKTLYNIATKSETQHVESVRLLIEKYDLNILNTLDFTGGYSASDLDSYDDGVYSLAEIATLYATLYEKGSASLQDALEVGCIVEVTDVNDLSADLITVEGVEDLELVFENLRSGSYSHYWAFDTALKANGIDEGCCSLGDIYCKTQQEYPLSTQGSNSGVNTQ